MADDPSLIELYLLEEENAQHEAQRARFIETFDGRKGVEGAIIDGELVMYGNEPYYHAYMRQSMKDKVEETKKKSQPSGVGYVKKSVFDALNVSTVNIPQNFAGLEAEMVPTRLQFQLFRIEEVVENDDYVEVTARHVWYDNLKNYTIWQPTAETDYTAAAACRNILTNAISPVSSKVASDCTDTKKGDQFDYKNKNLVECFLDPENGICAKFGLSLIRYNWDFYCLKNVGYNRGFVVENGKNLLGVERTESIENVATRVAAFGKDGSGNIVWLDYQNKKYVDSEHISDYSHPMTELLDTGLTIGKDGVTAQNIQQKLLEAAQKRFTEDHVDLPEVEMTIEFISLGDTEEYLQYRGLDKVYLYDIITVKDTVRGYNYTAQVIGVEHDILTGMLNSVTIGKLDNWDGTRKIATWQVPEINGENIRLKSILAGVFAPGAIQASDLTGVINAATINANEINAINAKLGTATIENGYINNADITIAKIKDLTAENFIAHDAVTDRYYIKKLAVDNAQLVQATVGELIVKASDNHYYRLDINAQGGITTSDVTTTLSNGEITAGVTSDGKCTIVETDLAVTDLAASNMKGINALIDKLTASRIDVDELFARSAFIGKLDTTDISGNGSLQLYVQTNAYARKTGIYITDNGVEIDAGKYVKIKAASGQTAAGKFIVESGNFTVDENGNVSLTGTVNATGGTIGGWTISGGDSPYIGNDSTKNSSTVGMVNASGTSDIVFWAGGAYTGTGQYAPKFQVRKDGTVVLTRLLALGEDGTESTVDLRQTGLWKLYYHTIKAYTSDSSGYCDTITLSSGATLNFKHAASGGYTGSWGGNVYRVYDPDENLVASTSVYLSTNATGAALGIIVTHTNTSAGNTIVSASGSLSEDVANRKVKLTINSVDKSEISTQATYNAGSNAVTLSAAGWVGGSNVVSASNGKSVTVNIPAISLTGGTSFSSHKTTVYASGGGASGYLASREVNASSEYNAGGATAKVNQSSQTLGYGASVTVKAQYVNASGTTVDTSSSCTITAPADRYWTGYNACAGTVGIDGTNQTLGYSGSVTLHGTYTNQGGQTTTRGTRTITAPAVPSITSCTMGSAVTGTTYNVTVALAGTTKSSTINAAAAYNAGWNAAMDACGFTSGGEEFYTGGVNYVNVWTAPNSYGVRLSNARVGYTTKTAPARK